jgi:hypothetical protein
VLRYELETFVCDGQYEKGLSHILETYLKNIDQAQQPAVWVSGFYGSGKSHLVKMLRALWVDTVFEDGATARGIANLPQGISDHFKELSTQAKRHGGCTPHPAHWEPVRAAVSDWHCCASSSNRRACRSSTRWPASSCGSSTKASRPGPRHVEKNGFDWIEELDNFYVAEGLHEALVQAKPKLFSSPVSCVETLNNLYPYVQDVSSDDMLKAIRQA